MIVGWRDAISPPASSLVGGTFTFPMFSPDASLGPQVRSLALSLIGAGIWLAIYRRAGARGRRGLIAVLPLATYAALLPSILNTAPFPSMDPTLHRLPPAVAAFLRQHQGLERTYIVRPALPFLTPLRSDLPERSGIVEGLYVVSDRENVYLRRFADYAQRLMPAAAEQARGELTRQLGLPRTLPQGEVIATALSPNLQLLDMLGVRFIVEGSGGRFRPAAAPGRYATVFYADGVRVYQNAAALPRAFLVHHVEVIGDEREVLDRLAAADFDPRRSAIVEHPLPVALPAGAPPTTGTARIIDYQPQRVTIDVDSSAAALLVLTDQYYPGWEATLDDGEVDILVTDYLFRGVAVPAGRHRVVFEFVPRPFWYGLALGVAGLALAVAILWAARRRAGLRTEGAPHLAPAGRLPGAES